ncbi:MAG: RIO-like kinase [Micromonosporaceae bacterium]|nr:RIO-like kinase [Micromonosporaceae bacterium]
MPDDDPPARRRRPRRATRFDDDPPATLSRSRRRPPPEPDDTPQTGDRWSSWDLSAAGEQGPRPYPDWLVTELAAVDTELGVLKTGKEADVHLVDRAVPDTDRGCLLAAKRYRDPQHRLFHRDAGYLEGRRVRRSRETRAMAHRTGFGRQVIAGQWAAAEFAVLGRLWESASRFPGGPVAPYPVQLLGTEILMEFIGDPDTGQAAPRLAQLRPTPVQLADLWERLVAALRLLATIGLTHGDLSPYNVLVLQDRPILIDLPQVVDLVANPRAPQLLARDVRVICDWFTARGLPDPDPAGLTAILRSDAGLR